MVQLTNFLMALLAASSVTSALAAQKPIRQRIADSTRPWKQACRKAHGGPWCHAVSAAASLSLRSRSAPCEQQDAADMMVDLTKTLNNNTADMIRLAQIFVQQPRNTRDGLQVPYCQKAPRNAELHGFYHCQFSGSDFTKFSGNQTGGSLPPGVSAVVPPGSCLAYNSSVPNGVQLYKLVSSPGKPSSIMSSLRVETFTNGSHDDDGYPEPGAFPSNRTHPTHNTNNTGPDNVTSSSFLGNWRVPTPSGNVSISSPLHNGTLPSSMTSLFSNLLGSNTLPRAPAPVPGDILRRAEMSGMKDAKPEHIPYKSNRVRPRPKHQHVRPRPGHFRPKHKHGKSELP